jgi:hypothetical protein
MAERKRTALIQTIILVTLLLLTVILAVTFMKRVNLPYNGEGRYFDEAHLVVYHKQAVAVLGFLSLMCFAATITMLIWIRKTNKKQTFKTYTMLEANRIYFKGNPYPKGHKIKRFVWSGRLDENEQLWFDFHLETDDYYAEDDTEDDEDDDEVDSNWEAKAVWENYHSCIISSTEWQSQGIEIDTTKGKFDFASLLLAELTVDPLPIADDLDFDDLSFQISLLGHDSCAGHQIKFSKNDSGNYNIEWRGKIALTYSGEDEFKYDFIALIQDVKFDGFHFPQKLGLEKAKQVFDKKLKAIESYEFVDLNPKSNKREYKLQQRK